MSKQTETIVKEACERIGRQRHNLLDILLQVQEKQRCVSEEAMKLIKEELSIDSLTVEGVVSFYAFLSQEPKGKVIIRLCDDIVDRFAGIEKVAEVLCEEFGIQMGETTADGKISLEYTPCIGMCDQAPAALVNDVVVTNLDVNSTREMAQSLKKHMNPAKLVKQVGDGNNANKWVKSMVKNNILRKGEVIFSDWGTPEAGLKKALAKTPKDVIKIVQQSFLKGRGGAGFPTGTKWKFARASEGERRYIFCNADEGEPGTFKDRVLLTEYPDLMFEGMTIAAYAVGSDSGIVYLRGEYAYLRPFLEKVLEERRKQGLLGENICGKQDFHFDIRIQMGAGAYICGEETALISSCEGHRGNPKTRPPYPAQQGYLGAPTVVNNVETLCRVPRILERGAEWFTTIGTQESTGTKLLSVSGDCESPGVYEVAWGITVKKLLKMVGAEDAAIVVVGGPSGQMIGRDAFDRRIAFEDLPTGGSIVVFGAERSVLEIVHYYMEFFIDESCGYCTPCRVGNVLLNKRIEKIMEGLGELEDIKYLKNLSNTIIMTSRCGLGHTSPNPILSSLEHFPLVYSTIVKKRTDGLQQGFDIKRALEKSREIAKRRSMIYDTAYGEKPISVEKIG
ncbi:MAG: NAD(P)H-dependent oxidoreductase subunit E [SAR324 cluster bacterium]|nr:NAD(P)H-dependent oxidoreductase subunit E [SAR324 cluster bacterium]